MRQYVIEFHGHYCKVLTALLSRMHKQRILLSIIGVFFVILIYTSSWFDNWAVFMVIY